MSSCLISSDLGFLSSFLNKNKIKYETDLKTSKEAQRSDDLLQSFLACQWNFIRTDEDPGLQIESFAIIKSRGVSTKMKISRTLPVLFLVFTRTPLKVTLTREKTRLTSAVRKTKTYCQNCLLLIVSFLKDVLKYAINIEYSLLIGNSGQLPHCKPR